jgi:protein-disulfide isomerase
MANSSIGAVVGSLVLGTIIGIGGTYAVTKGGIKKLGGSGSSGDTCSVDGAGGGSADLFTIGGKAYTSADLPNDSQDVYFQVENQAYRGKRDFLEDVALRIALAQEKNPSVDLAALPPLSELLSLPQPSEEEMKEFFKKNEKNLPPGSTYEQLKPQLQQFLGSRSLSTEVAKKVTELEQAGKLKFSFAEPVPPRVELPVADYPSKGNANAAFTLVEVSDYLCPHCRTVKPEVDAILAEMGDKVKVVQVNFSLRPTGLSGYLARGAYCASKQSADFFWKYHDKAFTVPLDAQQNVSPDANKEFLKVAVEVGKDTGADVKALESCIDSAEATDYVSKTNQVFGSKGVSGTPTFFLNNRKLVLAGKGLRESVAAAVKDGGSATKSN